MYLVLFANKLIRGMVLFYLALTVGPAWCFGTEARLEHELPEISVV